MPSPPTRPDPRPAGAAPRARGRSGPAQRRAVWTLFAVLAAASIAALVVSPDDGDADAHLTAGAAVAGDTGAEPAEGEGDATSATTGDITDAGTDGGETTSFTLLAVGDVLVHESVAEAAATASGFDFSPMFAEVAPTVASADLALCHLETPLSGDNTDLSYYPAFRVPFQIADAVAAAGFDGCSFASNHTLDAGPEGVVDSIAQLRRVGLGVAGAATSGAEADAPMIYDVGGVPVGHLSYTYGLNPPIERPPDQEYLVDLIDGPTILADAAALRAAGAEVVVVSLQWGEEYQSEPTPEQEQLALELSASPDIDLIIGHQAHVVQPVRRVGDLPVLFGLGNFLSNQSPESCSICPAATQDGVMLLATFARGDDGTWSVTTLDARPTWVDRTNGYVIRLVGEGATGAVDPTVAAESARRTLGVLDATGALDGAP